MACPPCSMLNYLVFITYKLFKSESTWMKLNTHWIIWVFCGIWYQFQILSNPLFPISISAGEWQQALERTTQNILNWISQRASLAERNLNWKSIIYILDRRNVNREFQIFKMHQKYLIFSSKWSDGLFCNSMLNFFLFRLQIVFKAAQKQDYNIIHLQRLKLQTVSNRNSFYGLSTELGAA